MARTNVFITGIHSGLGNALTKAFLGEGAEVYAISRQLPKELEDEPRLRFRVLDLAKTEEVRDGIQRLLRSVERLDLVVLNAAILGEIKDLRDTSLHEIAAILDVNVWANKLIYDTLLDMQIPIQQLVAISSGAAVNGSAGWGAYSISKSALNLLLRVYAHEHPQTHVTCLAPGLVHSQMLDYICSLQTNDRYPAIEVIRSAFGTERMQTPSQAADRLIQSLPKLLEHPTGSYLDIREI